MGDSRTWLDRARLEQTLITVLDHALPICASFEYRLVGTGAALLQGVDLPTGDADILVKERQAVDAFGAALASFPCLEPPTLLPEARQYYGNWDVDGVEVGVSTVEVESDADTIETFGRGPWEHFVLVPCGPHLVPAVTLELRLISELYRNRPDRYEPLIQYLRSRGCDIGLLRRGIAAAGLSHVLQNEALRMLLEPPAGRV